MTIVKILFALLVVFPVAALSYYFLKRLVDELYDKKYEFRDEKGIVHFC